MLILPIIERIVLHYSLACVNMSKILCCCSLCSVGSASETEDSVVEDKGLNLYVSLKL